MLDYYLKITHNGSNSENEKLNFKIKNEKMKNERRKTKNPTSEQFKTVINNFISVLPKAEFEDSLNMMSSALAPNEESVCSTRMCHASWYATSKKVYRKSDGDCFGFIHGANMLANDLGLEDWHVLIRWALTNPELWGNQMGHKMFGKFSAFQENPDDEVTLKSIINWWIKVHNRTHPDVEPIELLA